MYDKVIMIFIEHLYFPSAMLSTWYIFFSFNSHSTLIDRFYYISENLSSISMVHHKRWQNQDLNSGRVCDSNTHVLNHQVILPHNYTIFDCLGTQQLRRVTNFIRRAEGLGIRKGENAAAKTRSSFQISCTLVETSAHPLLSCPSMVLMQGVLLDFP